MVALIHQHKAWRAPGATLDVAPVPSLQWIVSQIGARQHYGIPRGFVYRDHLQAFYTDLWCRWGSSLLRKGPGTLRAFAGRFHPDLPSVRVFSFGLASVHPRFSVPRDPSTGATYEGYLRFGKAFSEWVTRDLATRPLSAEHNGFFGFNTGCLETLKLLGGRGIFTIVDQIDPARAEEELISREVEKWPGWQQTPGRIPAAYFDRLSAEWTAASLVVVNSEWSKQALIAQGVPARKLFVVPVAYEVPDALFARPPAKSKRGGPLTVLWLGTVNLRKGIQYLIGAARLLARTDIRFLVAGPLEISRAACESAPANLRFLGRITRDQTGKVYDQADVFVLPTVSDGFAITQVEAMARGLPVITTPNCGQVVTPGIDGLLVPVGDARALAEAIAKFDADRTLLQSMSQQAVIKASTFHLPRQAAEIDAAVRSLRRGGSVANLQETRSAK